MGKEYIVDWVGGKDQLHDWLDGEVFADKQFAIDFAIDRSLEDKWAVFRVCSLDSNGVSVDLALVHHGVLYRPAH